MPQLPAANSNSSQAMNCCSSLTNSLTHQPTHSTPLTHTATPTPRLMAISHQPPTLLTVVSKFSFKVKIKVTLRLTVSQSVSLGVKITFWQSRASFCGAPSLTRGWVCLLYMLLALASAVFLRSEFLGTRDHVLPCQIWDFPFCHLLWLEGSRWRCSIPPPHGGHG
jgi:hypothetical protein